MFIMCAFIFILINFNFYLIEPCPNKGTCTKNDRTEVFAYQNFPITFKHNNRNPFRKLNLM